MSFSSDPGSGPGTNWVPIRVDASKKGCTGMFWRTAPSMGATSSDPAWPRNGATHKGVFDAQHPGWVRFENGYWLPVMQDGVRVCHAVE
jgi:hypothetical protein